ncbi:hypothetical protein SDRG_04125 [Saprolegnia diclina VS20]|uniref:Uncharacterized protein n=1 Tax=Saprolegnia diclina (strain VS20) TaxID=1156394 RepID=T0QK79_SAPDV|nr:hypothetical protein SDRG_04125 [Saprolegnia diclina VS20]EQC38414.1 hypothetical protein SDRG_04125 [Saprolegnia diclina VS20]|eukprot:XP_008608006.1 hypothetical protein SDRG_04125 [Saprolegnia diclina VS20]
MKAHVLGGSPNLVVERRRREKAEEHAKKAKTDLVTLTASIVPQVDALRAAVQALERDSQEQLELEAASQETFLSLQQQLEALRTHQHAAHVALHDQIDKKMDRLHYSVAQEQQKYRRHLQEVKTEVAAMKEHMAVMRGEMDSFWSAANGRLGQTHGLLEKMREQAQKESDATLTSFHTFEAKLTALDEKLFGLEKAQLQLHLARPSGRETMLHATTEKHRCDELHMDVEAIKADMSAYRSADRLQFDALTNRLRELARGAAAKHEHVVLELEELTQKLHHMATKLPMDLSQRFDVAQQAWASEIAVLKAQKTCAPSPPPTWEGTAPDETPIVEVRAHLSAVETRIGQVAASLHAFQVHIGTQVDATLAIK